MLSTCNDIPSNFLCHDRFSEFDLGQIITHELSEIYGRTDERADGCGEFPQPVYLIPMFQLASVRLVACRCVLPLLHLCCPC